MSALQSGKSMVSNFASQLCPPLFSSFVRTCPKYADKYPEYADKKEVINRLPLFFSFFPKERNKLGITVLNKYWRGAIGIDSYTQLYFPIYGALVY